MEATLNLGAHLGEILVALGILWLVGWAFIDTMRPAGFRQRHRRQRPVHSANPEALQELRDLVKTIQAKADRDSWSHLTALLIATSISLDNIGRLVSDQAASQVERFIGRTLRQIAEDAQAMPSRSEHLTLLGWHLGALIRAIEAERISELMQAVAMLAYVTHWPDEAPPVFFQPVRDPMLYPIFQQEFEQILSEPVDNVALFNFLRRWRQFSLVADTHLFLLIRVLDTFRRPFFHLCHAEASSSSTLIRLQHWVLLYLEGLRVDDCLTQYEALCYLITDLQWMTEGETEETYLVRRDTRPQRLSQAGIPPVSAPRAPLRSLQPWPLHLPPAPAHA
jgi:hypothetical protein